MACVPAYALYYRHADWKTEDPPPDCQYLLNKEIYDGPFMLPAKRYGATLRSVSYDPLMFLQSSLFRAIRESFVFGEAYECISSGSVAVVFIIFSPCSTIKCYYPVKFKYYLSSVRIKQLRNLRRTEESVRMAQGNAGPAVPVNGRRNGR